MWMCPVNSRTVVFQDLIVIPVAKKPPGEKDGKGLIFPFPRMLLKVPRLLQSQQKEFLFFFAKVGGGVFLECC